MKHLVAAFAVLAFAMPAAAAEPPTIVINPSVIGRTSEPIVIQGIVPGAREGTEVEIEASACRDSFWRTFGLARTDDAGRWRWSPSGPGALIQTNTRIRARANNAVSATVLLRRRVLVDLRRAAGRTFSLMVLSEFVNLHGKRARLERFTGGRWVLVRTVRLNRESYGGHTATVRVRTRGLQLRAAVPESLVRACYAAGVSAIVRS
jgi:hypothetical protein